MSDHPEQPTTFVAPDTADLAPLFPGYEFVGLIATGGMGAVYCATQKSLDRKVAIKILPREFSNDAAFCAGFEAEAKAMARLNHPNLIGVYDFGEVSGMLYIIMEFVPGKSLFHSSHGRTIDPAEVVKLITGICHGLDHAHTHGILHRDIKPSNVLLDTNARPKIGDFGLARPIGRKSGDGEEIFGTPHYTAPEVCDAPATVDHRADIFSVGVILHELLTGRLPADDPRPASLIVPCDARIDAIIRRATDPLPIRRYASALELAKDLAAIPNPGGPPAHLKVPSPAPGRPTTANRSKQPVHDNPHHGLWGIVTFALVVGIAMFAYKHTTKSTPQDHPSGTADASAKPATGKPNSHPATQPNAKPGIQPGSRPGAPPNPNASTTARPNDGNPANGAEESAAEPKFDVPGFLARGQKTLRERAVPLVSKHQQNLKENYWNFQKGVLSRANRVNANRAQTVAQATKTFATMDQLGSRIPTTLEDFLTDIPGVPEIHTEMLGKQRANDAILRREINEMAPAYIMGLGKQADRLKNDNDSAALALIEEEIAKTRNLPDYFTTLIVGDTLPPEKPPQPEDDNQPPPPPKGPAKE